MSWLQRKRISDIAGRHNVPVETVRADYERARATCTAIYAQVRSGDRSTNYALDLLNAVDRTPERRFGNFMVALVEELLPK